MRKGWSISVRMLRSVITRWHCCFFSMYFFFIDFSAYSCPLLRLRTSITFAYAPFPITDSNVYAYKGSPCILNNTPTYP